MRGEREERERGGGERERERNEVCTNVPQSAPITLASSLERSFCMTCSPLATQAAPVI